ncbi:MAG TPA: methyl-accepting chemotaxis protein [Allocoleopsis sp.]
MTQLPSKSDSRNTSNGRGPYSTGLQFQSQTSATNSPPLVQVPPYPDQKAFKQQQTEIGAPPETIKNRLTQRSRHQWFTTSLRTKATLLALAIGTLPVVLVGATAYFAASQGVRDQVLLSDKTRAGDLEDKLNIFLKQQYDNIILLSNLNFLTTPKFGGFFTTQEKNDILDRYLQTFNTFNTIAVIDLNGDFLYTSKGALPDNAKGLDWFETVLKTDRPFLSEPRRSKLDGTFNFFVSAPVKDKETGKTIAVMRGRIPMTKFQEVLGFESGQQQRFYLTDSNGQITASDRQQFLQKKLDKEFPQLLAKIQQNRDQLLTTVDSDHQVSSVLTYLPNQRLTKAYGLKWGVLLSRPTEIAFAAQRQLLLTILLGTAVTTLLVAALAAVIANRATRPILDAANAVDKIGQGELDTRVDVRGEDELAVLSSNINQMASQLGLFVQEQGLLAKVTGSRTFNLEELDELFKEILEDSREILNADRVLIYRFNPEGGGSVTGESVARNWPRALSEKHDVSYVPDQMRELYSQGHVFSTNNVYEAQLHPEQRQFLERLQVTANLEVPILHEGKPYALLMVHYCGVPHEWQDAEVTFLKQLAAQLGLSLDRVLLLQETEQLAEEQRELKEGLQKRALQLLQEVDPISKGDLTIRARVTADEIGTIADSYNATVSNLRKIVLQVQEAATQVAETTSSNETSVQSLSKEALRQAEEIARALERAQEMAESVRVIATNAEQAEVAVKQAAQTVQEGDQAMNRTVDGILAIRETVAETAKKVKNLGESSQKISTVVNLISTFAAQTNLLALNASIEAARAGEEGRGFAVVADEVRSLARQSAEATSEIEKLVAAIQAETNEVVAAMEAGTEQVVMGTRLVDETRQSLNKITVTSVQINQLVEAIAQATVVQSRASEAVTQTMTNVAQIADKTSKEASVVSSSFEQLLTVAQSLQEDIRRFKVS